MSNKFQCQDMPYLCHSFPVLNLLVMLCNVDIRKMLICKNFIQCNPLTQHDFCSDLVVLYTTPSMFGKFASLEVVWKFEQGTFYIGSSETNY